VFAGPTRAGESPQGDVRRRAPERMKYPIVVKCQDLAEWILGRTAKFPRVHRASLSARVEAVVLDLLCCVTRAAGNPPHRQEWLTRASEELDALRILVRLSCSMHFISHRQYRYFAEQAAEVGQMLGGWIKAQPPT